MCNEEPAEGDDTDEMRVIVHDIELERPLVRNRLPHVLDGLLDGGVVVDGDEIRRHESPGRMLGVIEALLDLLGLVLLHEPEDLFCLLAGQLLDHVGGVLGRHLVEDAGHLALLEHLHQLEQRGVVELVDDLPGALLREQAKQRDLLGQRQVPGDGGDVGRMGLVEQHPVTGIPRALHEPVDRFGEVFRLAHHSCPTR